jgi:hypothetical protein
MHMILGHVPLHDLHLVFRANIPDQVPDAGSHFPAQRRRPVFRYPNQMQMDLENGVRAPSVIWNPSSLSGARSLKPSPERRGLQPSQTGTVIRGVRLADWDSAERAALEVIATTDREGGNEIFAALLEYQDLVDDSDLLWSALQTIECCAKLAPWLMDHQRLSRMAHHENFSVRSTVASICMEFAEFAPDRVPVDLLMKLSVFDEDWYVEAPANAALKAMVRSIPAVLQIFYRRLHATTGEERAHAAGAIRDIAEKGAYLLDSKRLKEELRQLRELGDTEAAKSVEVAYSKSRKARRRSHVRYGL